MRSRACRQPGKNRSRFPRGCSWDWRSARRILFSSTWRRVRIGIGSAQPSIRTYATHTVPFISIGSPESKLPKNGEGDEEVVEVHIEVQTAPPLRGVPSDTKAADAIKGLSTEEAPDLRATTGSRDLITKTAAKVLPSELLRYLWNDRAKKGNPIRSTRTRLLAPPDLGEGKIEDVHAFSDAQNNPFYLQHVVGGRDCADYDKRLKDLAERVHRRFKSLPSEIKGAEQQVPPRVLLEAGEGPPRIMPAESGGRFDVVVPMSAIVHRNPDQDATRSADQRETLIEAEIAAACLLSHLDASLVVFDDPHPNSTWRRSGDEPIRRKYMAELFGAAVLMGRLGIDNALGPDEIRGAADMLWGGWRRPTDGEASTVRWRSLSRGELMRLVIALAWLRAIRSGVSFPGPTLGRQARCHPPVVNRRRTASRDSGYRSRGVPGRRDRSASDGRRRAPLAKRIRALHPENWQRIGPHRPGR